MSTFEYGTFVVDSDGTVEIDYLLDGGWFRGELGVFSLEGMDSLEAGSTEFMLEAAERVSSGSEEGHIVIQDRIEGSRIDSEFVFEPNFNSGEYLGVKSFDMTPGDEVAFILVPNNTFENTLDNPEVINQWGKLPVFSFPEANLFGVPDTFQFVDINGTGTIGAQDLPALQNIGDYNDVVFQARGIEGNLPRLIDNVHPERNWQDGITAGEITQYTEGQVINKQDTGVFEVGPSGQIAVDYLFDGGLYEGEIGIFNLRGLNPEDLNTEEFIAEAVSRAQSNSELGHLIVDDITGGAKFSEKFDWEQDFNQGTSQGKRSFSMTPGDIFSIVLVPNGTLEEAVTAHDSLLSKDPVFSLPESNKQGVNNFAEIVTSPRGAVVAFEDDFSSNNSSTEDFNDVVFSLEGVTTPIGLSNINEFIDPNRNWLETETGVEITNFFQGGELA